MYLELGALCILYTSIMIISKGRRKEDLSLLNEIAKKNVMGFLTEILMEDKVTFLSGKAMKYIIYFEMFQIKTT